jgi:hypothetical protein
VERILFVFLFYKRKEKIMEVNRIGEYEYQVVINGQSKKMGLNELMILLSSPIEENRSKNEMEEFWESEPAYPSK